MLSLKGVIGGKSSSGSTRLDVGKISWQKLSNKGTPPSVRCGASMVSYKNKGIYFGGVNDRYKLFISCVLTMERSQFDFSHSNFQ